MCSSQVCAKLAQKFWSLLNQPASHGPFWPKLWTSLATVFVDIFWKEKNWVGFRPFPMTHWKEFLKSWKKRRFEIFWSSWKSILRGRPHITSSLLRGGGGHKMMIVDDVREGGLSKWLHHHFSLFYKGLNMLKSIFSFGCCNPLF